MNQASQLGDQDPQSHRIAGGRWMAAFFLLAVSLAAQGQQGSSLADVARQARAQKQAQPSVDTNQAQQIADQLAEDQDDQSAPAGFKGYNAGDYALWVPAPYSMDTHDSGGTVLSGPRVGTTLSLVLAGNSIVTHWGNSDDAFLDAVTQFAHGYADSANCTKTTVANHNAYQCSLAGARLLGHSVSGNAVFIAGSSHIFPVFCMAGTDSRARDVVNDPHSTYQQKMHAKQVLAQEDEYVRQVWQKCESVFQSIRVKEKAGAQEATAQSNKAGADTTPGAAQEASFQPGKATGSANGEARTGDAGGAASLADIARQLQRNPGHAAQIAPSPNRTEVESAVPAGFKVHTFQYCSGARQCWDASVLVPVEAQLIASDCKQYAFEIKVQGSPFLLMAGSAGSDCGGSSASGPDLARWHQLVDPESQRAPGTFTTISSQTRVLDGKPAGVITLAFRKGVTEWMGTRVEVENNGTQVVVGCMAPRDHFPDGDAICSKLIGSLRLP